MGSIRLLAPRLSGRPCPRASVVVVLFVLALSAATAAAQTFTIQPGRSYLRASRETPPAALVLDLNTLGYAPGDGMRLERLGDFRPGSQFPDASISLGAVFSSSSVLLGPGEAHRIPGAINAGEDIVTSTTYWDSLTTDIPEDFAVEDTVVQVPPGATHLFIAVRDSLYNDNTDPDGDFAVRVSRAVLPGPASVALKIWAGLQQAAPQDVTAYDLVVGSPFSGIDIRDVCRLARTARGLHPGPR